jgi:hypothetical protein
VTKPATRVDIAFNASYATAAADREWTDVTDYVLTAEGIRIGHGRGDEFSQASPNTCVLTLDNSDGRFTPGLASSPYYPNVKIGRPLRVQAMIPGNLVVNPSMGNNVSDWSINSGVNEIIRSTAQFQDGGSSMRITASGVGNAVVATDKIAVTAGEDYSAQAWFRTNVTSRTCQVRIHWFDAGGSEISVDFGSVVDSAAGWSQASVTATAPANAVSAEIRGLIASPAAAENHYMDAVMFELGSTVSTYTDGDAAEWEWEGAAQNSVSLKPVDRFVGYVDEWPLEWPGVVEEFATSSISASSRMARMGLSDKLGSVIEQEFLVDSPVAYYVLGEPEGAQWANDTSGNGTRAAMIGTGTDVAFGSAAGPETDGTTGATFAGAKHLQAQVATYTPTAATYECFFATTWAHASIGNYLLHTTGPGGDLVALVVVPSTGVLRAIITTVGAGTVLLDSATAINDGLVHHAAVTVANGGTSRLYLDGVEVDTDATALTLGAVNRITLGQQGLAESQEAVLNGSLAHVAAYDTALSAARVAAHADAGSDGFAGETAAARLARYAGYAGLVAADYSFDTAALTPMAHVDTTGKSPVELMQSIAETDGGVLYDGPDGVLTYVARSARYNATSALTLNASAGQVQVGYAPRLDRSALTNKVTATTTDGTYSVTAENAASVAEYGVHSNADLELATTDTDEAHAAAWWRVNTYGEPAVRVPQVTVELAKRGASPQAEILGVRVGDKIDVNDLPSQSDENDKPFFVEGYAEIITDSQHFIEFNVSPTDGFDVWEIGHATYGQYDAYPIAY